LLPDAPFLADFTRFHERVALAGAYNALAQVLFKFTLPGMPDVYQGCELWDLSLVDPDNRRPVDFALRAGLLDALEADLRGDRIALVTRLRENWRDGRIKLFLTHAALHFRRERRQVMEQGDYRALQAMGAHSRHVIAFARSTADACALTVVGRGFTNLGTPARHPVGEVWGDTVLRLPETRAATYRDVLTGETMKAAQSDAGWTLPLKEIFAHLPISLLERV
jgi:(1->4)-alpha-D-glucan 1-alpha-D-glucosylmutase